MNTLQTNYTFSMVKKYLSKGGVIFENKQFDKIIKLYLEYLKTLEIKEDTIIRKCGSPCLFFKHLNFKNINVKNITKEIIYDYIQEISKLNWKLSYFDRCKYDLKVFINWMFTNNLIKISGDNILPKINWHKRTNIKTFYTQNEIKSLLNAIDINTITGKEYYLIIAIICYLGLRISDVVDLKLSNIDFNNNTISLIQYKTKEKLILPLIDEVKYPLIDYLKNVRPQDSDIDYIFITTKKPYRHKECLKKYGRIVGRYLTKANVDINNRKHGFHSLRFSFSTMLLNENVDLYSISTILGHQNIKTSITYLDIDISKLKELALEVPLC